MVNTRSGAGNDIPSSNEQPGAASTPMQRVNVDCSKVTKSLASTSASSVGRKKVETKVLYTSSVHKLRRELDDLKLAMDLDKEDVEELEEKLETMRKELAKRALANPDDEPDMVAFSEEFNKVDAEAKSARREYKRKCIRGKAEINRLEDEIKLLETEYELSLAKIDEEEEESNNNLSLSLDLNDSSGHKEKVDSWAAENVRDEEEPSPQKNSEPLEVIAQAIKMLADKSSSGNDKFLARQTTGKDLPIFNGKPEEWPAFISDYKRTTDTCKFSDSENMSRLRKCLKGEASRAVQCLMVSPENIKEVIDMLEKRFGNAELIIRTMIQKTKEVAAVKEDKLETLIEFGTAVINMTATIKSLNKKDHLNNPQLLHELELKLPNNLKMQWREWVNAGPERNKTLTDFTCWVKGKTELAYELNPLKIKDDKGEDQGFRGGRNRRREVGVHATEENPTKERMCNYCGKEGHWVHQCRVLRDAQPEERFKMIMDKKLCIGCLQKGHYAKDCQKKRECGLNDCKSHHNRLLHGTKPPQRKQYPPRETEPNKEHKPEASAGIRPQRRSSHLRIPR
jgi:hypothetical protein